MRAIVPALCWKGQKVQIDGLFDKDIFEAGSVGSSDGIDRGESQALSNGSYDIQSTAGCWQAQRHGRPRQSKTGLTTEARGRPQQAETLGMIREVREQGGRCARFVASSRNGADLKVQGHW
ncbi:hypothetical protein NT2_10_00400 [Caenibius tardaugens NBRC 16725]|uniref:Uncharacterized protein n=1 Tax=Caenibius tardaugens NBRC 16725 TaxID=1219035 RepID=U2YNX9_9SPHN|nr:hypothetical protein NT2_10_00400 [Caenibius tardaugens NBRC 16725]